MLEPQPAMCVRTFRVGVTLFERGGDLRTGIGTAVDLRFSPIILIVEDEWLVREEIAGEFRRAGWTVLEASTGEGAIGLVEAGEPIDALVTDIQLAGRASGWDVADVVHDRRPDVPIVYTSGNAVDARRLVPGSVFVPKPCLPATLVEACRMPEPLARRRAFVSRF
jgi:CheY-like chemotaxis protein